MKRAMVALVALAGGLVPMHAAEPEQVDVYVSGTDGCHTYRIPALVATKKGTLLAFCEGRRKSRADHGDIDLVLKRSTDGGRTWSPMQVVWDDGAHTIGNPCPVVDQQSGTIWLPFCRDNDRVFITKSTDDGATWAKPTEITASVKRKPWTWYATGPGHGIQLASGRLLVPCDHRDPTLPGATHRKTTCRSHAIVSDDHGATWAIAGISTPRTNECEAVQTASGVLYLNMRNNFGRHRRAFAWSKDQGATWSEPKFHPELVSPVCQASVVRVGEGKANGGGFVFSNPASTRRERMTVRLSTDGCKTWSGGKVLHAGPAAYSDLCVAADGAIVCLYERGGKHPYERITAARFPIEWLAEK